MTVVMPDSEPQIPRALLQLPLQPWNWRLVTEAADF